MTSVSHDDLIVTLPRSKRSSLPLSALTAVALLGFVATALMLLPTG